MLLLLLDFLKVDLGVDLGVSADVVFIFLLVYIRCIILIFLGLNLSVMIKMVSVR